MNCKKCGAPLSNEDVFCKNCGTPVNDNSAVQNQNMMNNGNNVTSNPVNADMANNMGASNVNPVPDNQGMVNNSLNGNISNQQMNYGNSMNTAMPNNMPNQNMNYVNNGFNTMPNQNQVSTNGVVNDADKKKKTMMIAGIAGAIVVVVLAVILTTNNIKNSNKDNNAGNNSGNNNGSEVNNGSGNNNGSGSNNGGSNTVAPTPSNTSAYKVKYEDFTFNIPDNMLYEVESYALKIGNEEQTWVAELAMYERNFENLKGTINQIQGKLQSSGMEASAAELKKIGNSEFITVEATESGSNYLVAYGKLNSMYVVTIMIYNEDNTYDYDALNKVANITSNATYNQASNSIADSSKFNFNFGELIKATE